MGHPVLREKAKPIERAAIATPSVQQLIDDMIETMREYHGIGLAAPQVHESVRIFVAGLEKEDERTGETEIVPIAVVNPEITALGRDLVEDWEGCLSIPDIRGKVPRNRRIRVRGFGRDGEALDMELEELPGARVPARERPPQWHPVLRPDEVVRNARVPRRVLALLGQGQGRVGGEGRGRGTSDDGRRRDRHEPADGAAGRHAAQRAGTALRRRHRGRAERATRRASSAPARSPTGSATRSAPSRSTPGTTRSTSTPTSSSGWRTSRGSSSGPRCTRTRSTTRSSRASATSS